jgi:putative flippase GtrA
MASQSETSGVDKVILTDVALEHPWLRPLARLMPELSYYTVVSAAALAIDMLVFSALTRGGMRAAVAGIVGYAVGLVVHYGLSVRFVFNTANSSKSVLRRFVEFVLSGLIGVAITWGIILVATEFLHLPAMFGKIVAVGTSFVIVFLLRRGIVFASRPR